MELQLRGARGNEWPDLRDPTTGYRLWLQGDRFQGYLVRDLGKETRVGAVSGQCLLLPDGSGYFVTLVFDEPTRTEQPTHKGSPTTQDSSVTPSSSVTQGSKVTQGRGQVVEGFKAAWEEAGDRDPELDGALVADALRVEMAPRVRVREDFEGQEWGLTPFGFAPRDRGRMLTFRQRPEESVSISNVGPLIVFLRRSERTRVVERGRDLHSLGTEDP